MSLFGDKYVPIKADTGNPKTSGAGSFLPPVNWSTFQASGVGIPVDASAVLFTNQPGGTRGLGFSDDQDASFKLVTGEGLQAVFVEGRFNIDVLRFGSGLTWYYQFFRRRF